MASSPSFDPNSLRSSAHAETLKRDSEAPLINRATEFGYAPGSTFKIITASAAIDTGAFMPESTLSGRNDIPISGVPLQNDDGESFGQITLTQALAHSVNTVYAQVAVSRGGRSVTRATCLQEHALCVMRAARAAQPNLDSPVQQGENAGAVYTSTSGAC